LLCGRGSEALASIELTLISPEPGQAVEMDTVVLEGLISDLSVTEVKVLVNSQAVRFISVEKGYFEGKLFLDQRVNRVTFYGANARREYFRTEFEFINQLKRKKTISERIAPRISLNYLEGNRFKILSPVQFQTLKLTLWDNKNDISQVGLIWNHSNPVYLDGNQSQILLKLKPMASLKSYDLHVFAIDGDGNRSRANYHFRVERLKCELSLEPEMGLFEATPIRLEAEIYGGSGEIKKIFSLKTAKGLGASKRSTSSMMSFQVAETSLEDRFMGHLQLLDENGIEATCTSTSTAHLFSMRMARKVLFSEVSKLESVRQVIKVAVTPPVRQARFRVFLKSHDPVSGFSQRDWKTLGNRRLKSSRYRRDWTLELRKRVRPGTYLLKMSVELSGGEVQFTELIPVTIVRSLDDDQDLLEEILRDEADRE